MLVKCPECGHQVSDQAKTCPSCGIEIAGKITRCPDCGEVIFKEQSYCPNCRCSINGASVPQDATFPATQPAVVKTQPEEPEQAPPAPRRPRRHRAGLTAIIVAFVFALIVVFLGIYFMKNQERQNEQRAYTNAMLSTEPLVLQNFSMPVTSTAMNLRWKSLTVLMLRSFCSVSATGVFGKKYLTVFLNPGSASSLSMAAGTSLSLYGLISSNSLSLISIYTIIFCDTMYMLQN